MRTKFERTAKQSEAPCITAMIQSEMRRSISGHWHSLSGSEGNPVVPTIIKNGITDGGSVFYYGTTG